jgi:hypothetical protein
VDDAVHDAHGVARAVEHVPEALHVDLPWQIVA